MPSLIPCPRCRQPLDVPSPAPERIRCAKCGAVIKNTAKQPAAVSASAPAEQPARRRNLGLILGLAVFGLLCVGLGGWAYVALTRENSNSSLATGEGDDANELDPSGSDPEETLPEPKFERFPKNERQKKEIDPRIQKAVDAGVAYLRKHVHREKGARQIGELAIMGLTLLECGAAADDADVQHLATAVRAALPKMNHTYDAALSILFLDRLHQGKAVGDDARSIKSLGLRLIAGQSRKSGLWSYRIPVLDTKAEYALLGDLRTEKYESHGGLPSDLSNSQFAALALWVARKYDVPVQPALKDAVSTIRPGQNLKNGTWGYLVASGAHRDTGTCVGMILLALARGIDDAKKAGEFLDDPSVKLGVAHLGWVVTRDTEPAKGAAAKRKGGRFPDKLADAHGDLYFLWTLERTALILNLKTINKRDWYDWGSRHILDRQNPDGSWTWRAAGARQIDRSV